MEMIFLATLIGFGNKFIKRRSVETSNCLRPSGRVFEVSAKAFDESRKQSIAEKLSPDILPFYKNPQSGGGPFLQRYDE
jgi:hypothetical protein